MPAAWYRGGFAWKQDSIAAELPHRSGIERPENSTVCCFQRDGAEAGPWRSTREAGDRALLTNRSARRYVQRPPPPQAVPLSRVPSRTGGPVLAEDLFRRFAPPSPKGKASPPDGFSGARCHLRMGEALVCDAVMFPHKPSPVYAVNSILGEENEERSE